MAESFIDLHKGEILTDNTKIKYCEQCKDCVMWGNGDSFSNQYDKVCCDMFKFPERKTSGIINNKEKCPYKVKK